MPNAQTAGQGLAPPSERVSPELVLVDPFLAAGARYELPDRPDFPPVRPPRDRRLEEPVHLVSASPPPIALEPDTAPSARPEAGRKVEPRRRRARLAGPGALAVAGILLAFGIPTFGPEPVLVEDERRSAAPAQSGSDAFAATPKPRATDESEALEPSPRKPAADARPAPAPPKTSQTFVWPQAKGASSYEFQLLRGGTRVFRARTAEARLTLPATWRQDGRVRRLSPGTYRWYVWPVPAGKKKPAAAALVQARIVVPKESKPSGEG